MLYKALLALILALAVTAGTVKADSSITYRGVTTPSSITYSPALSNDMCQPTNQMYQPAERFYYNSQAFVVTQHGTYTLSNISNTYRDSDSVLALYQGRFTNRAPLAGLIAINDDQNDSNYLASISCELYPGVIYSLVTMAYDHQSIGRFTNQISGPGMVRLLRQLPTRIAF